MKTLQRHTPGPWRLVQRRAAGAFTPHNGLTLRHLVVDTGRGVWTTSQVQTGGYTDEQLEQARLITAAPIGHELIARAVADQIDDKWIKDARAYLKATGGAK